MTMTHEGRHKQGYIGDLSKKTRAELLDLISRQEKLLANSKFINRLPDKGEKIIGFKQEIEEVLNQKKEGVSAVADELAKLRITQKPAVHVQELDSDDEEDILNKNPTIWETLAANGLPTKTVSTTRSSNTMPALETSDDELGETSKGGFYTGLANVMDEKVPEPVRQPLKLNRPRHPVKTVKPSKLLNSQVEEESAVRYPIGPHAETKALTISESLQLQTSHMLQMKELQVKQAVERLAQKMNIAIGEYEPEAANKMNYRDASQTHGETDDEADDD